MNLAVSVRGLAKSFGEVSALRGVDLDLPTGSLFGLCGPDGAGKTTWISLLATLRDPDAGEASVLGKSLPAEALALRPQLGYMPQRFSLYGDLTVNENLEFFSGLFGLRGHRKAERIATLLAFSGLGEFRKRLARDLSGGMKQKLALSCILLHEPPLLLLDEPTVGVDPVARREFWRMLRQLRDAGHTLLVSTPYMDEAGFCDRLAFLHEGRILAQGTPEELRQGYPHRLYRLTAGERPSSGTANASEPPSLKPLRYPVDRQPPDPCALLYAFGASLHAAVPADRDRGAAPLAEALEPHFPAAAPLQAEPVEPGLEDVLLSLLLDARP